MTNDRPPKACLADFGFTTMVSDPQNPMSSSPTLEGGTLTFMAPELLAPSKFGLKSAVPTQEGDIYAFGLVILQVFLLYRRHLLVFPDALPGPDGGTTVSKYQTPGNWVPRRNWWAPREAPPCGGSRNLRLLVEAHREVLGWRNKAKTQDSGGRNGSQRCRS